MKKQSIILLLTFLTSSAHGMIYSWTDIAGIAHYTNKEYEIPVRYRAKVKARYPELSDISKPHQSVQTSQTASAIPPEALPTGKPGVAAVPNQKVKTPPAKSVIAGNGSLSHVDTRKTPGQKQEHAGKWKRVKIRAERSTYLDE